MSKRVQVTIGEEEYRQLQLLARRRGMTVAELARQTIRDALEVHSKSVEAKLRAVAEAYAHQHPTADIDDMLAEIEAGRNLQGDTAVRAVDAVGVRLSYGIQELEEQSADVRLE